MSNSYIGKGAVHVYTGDGKGKTTASLGLALRAVGWGLDVMIIQFMKRRGYGEHKATEHFKPQLEIVQVGTPYFVAKQEEIDPDMVDEFGGNIQIFPPGSPPTELIEQGKKGIDMAHKILTSASYDLLILDEINVAIHYNLVPENDVLQLIDMRPKCLELVLTGRNASQSIIDRADLVTEMCEVKHYWRQGLMARKGIEE